MTRFPFILLLIVLLAAAGCERHDAALEARVHEAYLLADVSPDSAIAILDSLAPRALTAPRASRARHALATVKARDKAFITHSSDTTILPLIDYYSRRPASDTLRPVALYYAGRVYADMGDAPRALDYLQQALDALPANQNPRLRSCIHAQMGSLFYNQLMLDDAIAETKEGLRYDIIERNPIKETKSLQSLGFYYHVLHKHDSAGFYYNSALKRAKETKLIDIERQILRQLSMNNLVQGKCEEAERLFKSSYPNLALREETSTAHSIGAHIAIAKGNEEEALPYLRWLCDSGTIHGKIYALKRLAFIKMNHTNKDSALLYLSQSFKLEDSVNQNKDSERIAQIKSSYEYGIREKENALLISKNTTIKLYLTITISLLIIAVLVIVWKHSAHLRRIRELNTHYAELRENYENSQSQSSETNPKLQDIIIKFKEYSDGNIDIKESDWNDLKATIKVMYPAFNTTLQSGRYMSDLEWKVTMLIKLEFKPADIARCVHRSKETISSVRRRLFQKVFSAEKGKPSPKDWDEYIRSL